MPNPESVILNLVQNLFRAGLFQHLIKSIYYETLKRVQGDKKWITIHPLSRGEVFPPFEREVR
jgi:hypothetical protein